MGWLLDSNVFMQAAKSYYQYGFCPGFWDWLKTHASQIRSVELVLREIEAKSDALTDWCHDELPDSFYIKPDEEIYRQFRNVSEFVNALPPPFDINKKRKFLDGADSMLLATAICTGDVIVTHEKDDPRAHNKIYLPVVAEKFNVQHTKIYDVMLQLDAKLVQEKSSENLPLNP